jgi:hypothetical protein
MRYVLYDWDSRVALETDEEALARSKYLELLAKCPSEAYHPYVWLLDREAPPRTCTI